LSVVGVLALTVAIAGGLESPRVPVLGDEPVRLGRFLELRVEEPGEALDAASAFRDRVTASTRDEPSFGFVDRVIWARFRTPAGMTQPWVLRLGFPRPLDVTLYEPGPGGALREVARRGLEDNHARDVLDREIVVPIDGSVREHVLRVHAVPARINAELVPAASVTSIRAREMLVAGIYYGIFLGLFLYNLFLGASLKDGVQVLYCAFLVCMAGQIAVRDGLIPWAPPEVISGGGGLAMTAIVMLVFARRFLRLAPSGRLARVLTVEMGLGALVFVAALFGAPALRISALLSVASIVTVMVAASVAARAGQRSALWFLVAWAVLVVSAVWSIGLGFGVVDGNAATRQGLKIGSAIEMVLLSLALASRVRALRDEKERAEVELERARSTARAELTAHILEASEAERARFAREVHDGIGHSLLLLKERLRAAVRAGRPLAVDEADALARDAQRCIDDARALARNLAPPELEKLGLAGALESTVEGVRRSTGVHVVLEATGADGVDARLGSRAVHLFRLVQEAVTNAVKHASASEVRVCIGRDDDVVVAEVIDDGVGFDARRATSGLGLVDMHERARLLGAQLDISSVTGEGTRVSCRVPIGGGER
jgi:signal transduction histidine kinase